MAETPYLDELIAEGASAIVTTEVWQEIKDSLGSGGGSGALVGQRGFVTLGGLDGVTVTISDAGENYDILFWLVKGPDSGSTGEISFEIIDNTSFKVYNTGSDVSSVLKYLVIPATEVSVRGTVTLAGSVGVTATIADMGTTDFDVLFWVEKGADAGSTGEVTIEIVSSTSFKVFNSGSDVTSTLHYLAVSI
jgi:hypothetical protein